MYIKFTENGTSSQQNYFFDSFRNELTKQHRIKTEPVEVVDTTEKKKLKSQQTIIYEHQKEVSQYIPSKLQPKVPGSQANTFRKLYFKAIL